MAIQPEELNGAAISQVKALRFHAYEDGIQPGQLAQLGADTVLDHGTPLTVSGATWIVWVDGAAIDGFLFADDGASHTGLLAGETSISVFKRGLVHHDDVPLPTGETAGLLSVALRATELRQKGVIVQGTTGIA